VTGNLEELSAIVVDTGFRIHKDLGPGLLESVYELILAEKLRRLGIAVDRQRPINISYEDVQIESAFRVDLLIERRLVVEIKSLEQIAPVHAKQILTYIRLMNLPLGLLMNFGAATFREGVRRLVNNHTDFASSRLRANQSLSAQ
jgi:iron complex transport system substrate-binding protein